MHPGTPRRPEEHATTQKISARHVTLCGGASVPVRCTYAASSRRVPLPRYDRKDIARRRHRTIAGEHGAMHPPKEEEEGAQVHELGCSSSAARRSARQSSRRRPHTRWCSGPGSRWPAGIAPDRSLRSCRCATPAPPVKQNSDTRCEQCVAMHSEHNSHAFLLSLRFVICDLIGRAVRFYSTCRDGTEG